ncbi:MAG: hypothetical protein E6H07_19255 [Bacteroidetes bacterium]|nr:MAG: hypothetical protein E6H07_19255 [Bacteroidota bacterium]
MPRVEAFNNQPEKIEYFPERLFRSITFAYPYCSYNLPVYGITDFTDTIYPQTLSLHNEKEALIKNTALDGLQNVDCLKLQS